ncbi:MAG: bifunctional riboflavin kinase/FAD synthetase [Candidatus Zixiibacteriota bacterium]|nr:MAG: bifunctional riboflavin kinase/FAD synthetase [candidate division Zixibacteria bacterium]
MHADAFCGPRTSGPAVVTVGTFDGVHRGHQEILRTLDDLSGETMVRTVVTFDPHPQSVIRRDGRGVPLLTETREKIRLLCLYGVDRLLVLHFDRELAALSAEDFLQEILLKRLQAAALVIGYNHNFGRNREGSPEFLEQNRERFGYLLSVVGPHYVDGEPVSSTRIRRALETGDVARAHHFLGRPYALSGTVVAGNGRGRALQFPTANLKVCHPDKLVPPLGIYAVEAAVGEEVWPGMMSIGTRPTFGGGEVILEVHLIGFSGDIYGRTVEVRFLKKLRDEERYAGVEELVEQITRDQEASLEAYREYQAGRTGEPTTE